MVTPKDLVQRLKNETTDKIMLQGLRGKFSEVETTNVAVTRRYPLKVVGLWLAILQFL